MDWIICVLCRADGTPFYVGQTSRVLRIRVYEHRRMLRNAGLDDNISARQLEIVEEHNWQARERHWIRYFRKRFVLTNITAGGQGVLGYRHSEGTKEKLRGNQHAKGITYSRKPEDLQRTWATRRARGSDRPSEDSRKKMSEAGRRRAPITEITRAKMSEASRGNQHSLGKKHTDETKRKISEAHKGKTTSAETKAKMSAAALGKNKGRTWSTDSLTGKRVWKDRD